MTKPEYGVAVCNCTGSCPGLCAALRLIGHKPLYLQQFVADILLCLFSMIFATFGVTGSNEAFWPVLQWTHWCLGVQHALTPKFFRLNFMMHFKKSKRKQCLRCGEGWEAKTGVRLRGFTFWLRVPTTPSPGLSKKSFWLAFKCGCAISVLALFSTFNGRKQREGVLFCKSNGGALRCLFPYCFYISFHNEWHTFQVKRCCFAFSAGVASLEPSY